MIYKFNGGYGAVLCSECYVVLATGKDAMDILFKDIPEEKYNVYDINDRLKVMSDTHCFCSKTCRDKYYKKRIENSLIID